MTDVRFFYIRDKNRSPIATVATRRRTTGVIFAVAAHNPAQKFDRELSKQIAKGRLFLVPIFIEAEPGTIRGKILEYIADDKVEYRKGGTGPNEVLMFHLPDKVVKSAAKMLNAMNENYAGFFKEPPEVDDAFDEDFVVPIEGEADNG